MLHPAILIADDQKHMLMLLQATLEPIGGQILTASSGEEALVKAAGTPIDLLLIDFEMSGLTGVETVRRLKGSPPYANLPIIMITGRGQNRVRAEAIQAGVTLVILKPFSPVELQETVQRLLAGPADFAASCPSDQKL
jgi:CheY-like chemotaxis protein